MTEVTEPKWCETRSLHERSKDSTNVSVVKWELPAIDLVGIFLQITGKAYHR
jgi:hypothetical protein